jgi:hypothetical protein
MGILGQETPAPCKSSCGTQHERISSVHDLFIGRLESGRNFRLLR